VPGRDYIADLKKDYRAKRRTIEQRLAEFRAIYDQGDEAIFEECRAIRDGGGFGSIIGRNSFQRQKPRALAFLSTVMKIYSGEKK